MADVPVSRETIRPDEVGRLEDVLGANDSLLQPDHVEMSRLRVIEHRYTELVKAIRYGWKAENSEQHDERYNYIAQLVDASDVPHTKGNTKP